MKRAIIFIIIVAIMSLQVMNCSGPKSKAEEEITKIPVEIEKVKSGSVVKELKYTGDILAEQEVKIYSKIPDRIVRFLKDEGNQVNKGDIIVEVEATKIKQAVVQAEAALVSAKAQLANLQSEYKRAERLKKEDAMSQQQFDAIATQYEATQALAEQAEAALIQAKSQLADASITAPISGIIGVRNYEQGDMATGPFPLATIVQMNRVKAEINAPEQDLGQIRVGQCANISVSSYPDEVFVGTISKIRPVLDPITRMGKIEILIDNADSRLKPGMYSTVSICVNTFENVIVIPKHAILENTALKRINGEDIAIINYHVFVEKEDRAYLRDINISYTNGTVAVVEKGLTEDENIVIVGQQSLKDSAMVQIMNAQE